MIERLQKLSAEIFKAALKTYTRNDVLVHKRAHTNNLSQIFSLFPNQGAGFFIFKKSWSPGIFYEIKRADYKSYRHGHFYGIKNVKLPNGQQKVVDKRPIRLHGLSKRGVWTYSIGNFEECKTNNGVSYTKADFEAFIKVRGIGVSKNPQPAEDASAEQLEEKAEAVNGQQ